MSNKEKKIINNRVLEIREELGYTQAEFGKILEVSDRMICNYETGESNLPIDKAVLISEKYNYSLDWIYCNTEKTNNQNYTQKENLNFSVDIRDFVTYLDNQIIFSINNNYWEYLKSANTIINSNKTDNEKARKIRELNGSYKRNDNDYRAWEFSITADEFRSILKFNKKSIPYISQQKYNPHPPTEEQIKEVTDFLDLLTKDSEE